MLYIDYFQVIPLTDRYFESLVNFPLTKRDIKFANTEREGLFKFFLKNHEVTYYDPFDEAEIQDYLIFNGIDNTRQPPLSILIDSPAPAGFSDAAKLTDEVNIQILPNT